MKSGSAIVSLQPSFLSTLSYGDHTLKATFDDGNDVEVPFKTAAKESGSPTPSPAPGSDGSAAGTSSGNTSSNNTGSGNTSSVTRASRVSSPSTGEEFDGMVAVFATTGACALCLAALVRYRRRFRDVH